MKKVVVILSGGMDSATMLYWYKSMGHDVKPITFDYNQRHATEIVHAGLLCHRLGLDRKMIQLPIGDVLRGSSQSDGTVPVPEGRYDDETMKKTVVPNRNMIMLAVAGAYAVSIKADILAYGAHAGDHTIYPDCRATFVDPMRDAFRNCDWHPIKLETPFLKYDKGDIVKLGLSLKVPYELTWTCYKGGNKHCGKCGACQERLEAFAKAKAKDPVEYEEGIHVGS